MSFCIKPSHKMLKPAPPAQPDKVNVMALLETERKTGASFLNVHFPSDDAAKQNENRPKTGSNTGMAIRMNPFTQADYM